MVSVPPTGSARLKRLFERLLGSPICCELRRHLDTQGCHLVGGALRDTALGHPIRDLDIVVAGRGAETAETLAEGFGTRAIALGGRRFGAFRIIYGNGIVDLWDRGSNSLFADLQRRDLTIHSFALDLHSGEIHDPFSGLMDLERQILRMTTSESFVDDPLRVLRLCRFAAQLEGFLVDEDTLDRARQSVSDLTRVAKERIRTELELILELDRVAKALALLLDLRILPETILDQTVDSSFRERLQIDLLSGLTQLDKIATSLPEGTDLARVRLALLMTLLNRTGGPDPSQVCEQLHHRGYLTGKSAKQISALLDFETIPAAESQMRWYLHRAGDLWPEVVAYRAVLDTFQGDRDDTQESLTRITELALGHAEEIFDPPVLLSGLDLQRKLEIEPGKDLGRILAEIRRQQIEGSIETSAAALALAARSVASDNQECDGE